LNRINRLQLWILQFGKTQFDNSFVFNNGIFQLLIRIYQALNTKTLKTRQVVMTNRVYDELLKLWENSIKIMGKLN